MIDLLRLLQQLKPFVWRIMLGMLLAVLMLVSAIGLLSLSGWFISATAFAGLMGAAAVFNYFVPAAGVRFFALTRIITRYLERLVSHDTTFRVLEHLRVWLYRQIEPLSGRFIAKQRRGDLLNRMVSDINALDNLYLRILSPILVALILTALLWFFLHWFSPLIANVVTCLLLISIFLVPPVFAWLGHRCSAGLVEATKHLRTHAIEGVQGLADVLVFQRHQVQVAVFMHAHDVLLKQQYRLSRLAGFTQASMILLMGLSIWLTLYLGIELVNHNAIDGANLALLVLGVLAAFEAITPLPLAFQYLGQTISAAKRIHEMVDQQPEVTFVQQEIVQPKGTELILDRITFAYHETPVLQDFSLKLKPGERVGIVGPSGCGKSTVLKLITRMFLPQKGEIKMGDVMMDQFSETQLRESMSILEQSSHVFNDTIRANLAIANPEITDAQCWAALKAVALDELVRSLPDGLQTYMGEAGMRLSGGQLRRLALARIVVHDAPIWLLDEPTEGLDYRTEQAVVQQILTLSAGKTVLWISHKPAGLSALDRIIQL